MRAVRSKDFRIHPGVDYRAMPRTGTRDEYLALADNQATAVVLVSSIPVCRLSSADRVGAHWMIGRFPRMVAIVVYWG